MSNSVLNDFLLYLQRNSPKSLQDRGVYCNVSNDKKRISFTYEQALADPADEIASICRGIIVASYVDIDIDKPIVQPRYAAIPFMRFFNAGTPNAAIIGVSKTKVLDKLDGTMMILYYCDHKWRVATRSTPDATAQTFSGDTYAQLFWSLFDKNLLEHLSPTFTYTFELIGPSNRHLVVYDTDELILTNIFDIQNRVEINIFEMQHNCKLPKVVDFTTIEALEKEWGNLEPIFTYLARYPQLKEYMAEMVANFDNRENWKNWRYNLKNRSVEDQIGHLSKEQLEIWKEDYFSEIGDIMIAESGSDKPKQIQNILQDAIVRHKHIFNPELGQNKFGYVQKTLEDTYREINENLDQKEKILEEKAKEITTDIKSIDAIIDFNNLPKIKQNLENIIQANSEI